MNKICLMVLFFSLQMISMEKSPSHEELSIVSRVLQKANITYDPQNLRAVKKPLVKLIEVDIANERHLIDLNGKTVVATYIIAQRPATC